MAVILNPPTPLDPATENVWGTQVAQTMKIVQGLKLSDTSSNALYIGDGTTPPSGGEIFITQDIDNRNVVLMRFNDGGLGVGMLGILPYQKVVTQSDLVINPTSGTIFDIEISSNLAFTFTDITAIIPLQYYYFLIKNTHATADITIAIPNISGVDIYAQATMTIAKSSYKEVSLFYTGTKRIWQISEQLVTP
jgi:hypothetical protein